VYAKNFYSFCTIIDQTNILKNLQLEVSSCYFEDIQDGIKMILNPASNVCLKIDKLKLELDLLDVEAGSHGINIQGKVKFIFSEKVITGGYQLLGVIVELE
jgi:hypothetical protein